MDQFSDSRPLGKKDTMQSEKRNFRENKTALSPSYNSYHEIKRLIEKKLRKFLPEYVLYSKQRKNYIPSKKEALKLLRKLEVPYHIINHQLAVMRIARNLAHQIKVIDVDLQLVKIGALMHDIGRSISHGLEHAFIGGEILRMLGYDEKLARIAETHTLGGISKNDARILGLPPKDYIPKTIEEKIVCLADKMVSGVEKVSIEERFRRWIEKHGESPFLNEQIQRVKQLDEEVLRLIYGFD